jgi:hypothetical protein
MAKIVRLTERDLTRIVRRVIEEQTTNMDDLKTLGYNEVIDIPNNPKDVIFDKLSLELYNRKTKKNFEDKKNGIIIAEHSFPLSSLYYGTNKSGKSGTYGYEIKFQIKDNKLKIEFIRPYIQFQDSGRLPLTNRSMEYFDEFKLLKESLDKTFLGFVKSIKDFLGKNLIDDFKP